MEPKTQLLQLVADQSISYLSRTDLKCADRRQYVENLYQEFGDELLVLLLQRLRDELKNEQPQDAIRLPLLYLLTVVGPEIKEKPFHGMVKRLIDTALSSPHKTTRLTACYVLCEIGGSAAYLPALRRLLDPVMNRSDPIKLLALRAIGEARARGREVVSDIVKCLLAQEHLTVRSEAVKTLGKIGPSASAVIPHLIHSLREFLPSGPVHYVAEILYSLFQIGRDRTDVMEAFRQAAASSPHVEIRFLAGTLVGTDDSSTADRPDFEEFVAALCVTAPRNTVAWWLDRTWNVMKARHPHTRKWDHIDTAQIEGLLRAIDVEQSIVSTDRQLSRESAETIINAISSLSRCGQPSESEIATLIHAVRLNQRWDIKKIIFKHLGRVVAASHSEVDYRKVLELFEAELSRASNGTWPLSVEEGQVLFGVVEGAVPLMTLDRRAIQIILQIMQGTYHGYAKRAAANAWSQFVSRHGVDWIQQQMAINVVEETVRCLEHEMASLNNQTEYYTTVQRQCCRVLLMAGGVSDAHLRLFQDFVTLCPKDVAPLAKRTLTHLRKSRNVSHPHVPVPRMDRKKLHEDRDRMSQTVGNDSAGKAERLPRDKRTKSSARHPATLQHLEQLLEQFHCDLRDFRRENRELRRENLQIQKRLNRLERKLDVLGGAALRDDPAESAPSAPAELIEAIQKRTRLSLEEIGNQIGLSKSQMSRIARGKCDMKKSALIVLQNLADEICE